MSLLKYLLSDSRWNWFARGLPSLAMARALFLSRNSTMTSFERCSSLWRLTGDLLKQNVPGALVECGVWRGGSAGIMGCASQHAGKTRPLHLFDSFEGLPEPGPEDGSYAVQYSGGKAEGRLASIAKCDAGLETVRAHLFQRLQLDPANVHFHVGCSRTRCLPTQKVLDRLPSCGWMEIGTHLRKCVWSICIRG